MRVDFHVHSKYSKRPSTWVLKKIGCPESFTKPLDIYRIAHARGMTHVTISDHNRIAGALEIAHLPNTFISEEITTYFPEDGCKLHVLALNITERQHADIQKLRENVFELVSYLHTGGVVHVLAHAFYAVNDRLTLAHFEKLLLLFKNFELNGARNDIANEGLAAVLNALRPETITALSERHGIIPVFAEPWKKNIIGGSDDHSSLNIARTYTEIPGARTVAEGLDGISRGRSVAVRHGSQPQTMAQNFYSIAYQYYRNKFKLERFEGKDILLQFMDRSLRFTQDKRYREERRFFNKIHLFFNIRKQTKARPESTSLIDLLRQETTKLLQADQGFVVPQLHENDDNVNHREDRWFDFVNQVSNSTLINFANHAMNHLLKGNVFNIFHSLGSAGGLYGLLAPYFIAYSLFSRDRQFTRSVCRRFNAIPEGHDGFCDRVRVAHFTDTFYDTNGVAMTIRQQIRVALRNQKHLQVITCTENNRDQEGVKAFNPIGVYDMPEYTEQKLYYPPLLEMLRYCYEQKFTRIHSATPGPIGLAALAIAKILKLPFCGTYHTQLPQYAQFITGDAAMEELTWKYVIWYYDQMDAIYAPSASTRQELIDHGINPEKVLLYPRGIDIQRFAPQKRNGFLAREYGLEDTCVLLYVGRLSKEKNLGLLVEAYLVLRGKVDKVHLVIVGDGPYLAEMQKALEGIPCTFTGVLKGDDLVSAYASADVFVFPSATDTFGNVILEAQACGLPVIVSDRGGPRENMLPGQTGLMVKANDRGRFMAAMRTLVVDTDLRRSLGAAARRYTEERSFDTAFIKMWDLYRSIPDSVSDPWHKAVGF
ncbi:MAG: glycosyltransferase [Desulfosarcina sp.]|nr:glycosyltransferase [Desulfobacterales bacterium]